MVTSATRQRKRRADPWLQEGNVLRASDNPKIYIRKVLSNDTVGSQKRKKLTRVYNTRHACFYCGVLVQHLPAHLKARHEMQLDPSVLHGKSKSRYDQLRLAGDNKHNKTVIEKGEGELLLARRPVNSFIAAEHGPCPSCFLWMHQDSMKLHQKQHSGTAISAELACNKGQTSVMTKIEAKKSLLVKSDILAGRFHRSQPSSALLTNVFPIMTRDTVSAVAKSDELIVALGDSWYRRSRGNPKAKYYASQHMRLMAKLLMHLRDLDHKRHPSSEKHQSTELESAEAIGKGKGVSDNATNTNQHHSPEALTEGKPLWDFIIPQHFDDVVVAALRCALPYMDDIEELASPTNAIRLKHDINRLVDFKWALIQTTGRGSPSKDANACDVFHRLMKIKWGEHVTKLARTVLLNRSFGKEPQIPSPEDMKRLTCYVVKELLELKLKKNSDTFKRAVQLSQTRLLIYNKRRSGEIDNIT